MAESRIKGQEVEVHAISGGVVQQFLAIKMFDFEGDFKLLEEAYLGQTSNQFDEIFNGVSGNIGIHLAGPAGLDFMLSIKDRAQRRVPGFLVNIKATFNFPNGQRRRIVFPNVFFGNWPTNVTDRTAYVDHKMTWKCGDIRSI
jgi:hypothetical protein